jgi:nucleoid DNA-binding protein
MTKRDQAILVSRATGLNAKKARDALDAVASVIRVGLIEEGKIKLDGLGTFSVQPTRPRGGVTSGLPESFVVKFKPTPELRASVQERNR